MFLGIMYGDGFRNGVRFIYIFKLFEVRCIFFMYNFLDEIGLVNLLNLCLEIV